MGATVGNGTMVGTYKMIAPYTMAISIIFTVGSTSTAGSSAWTLSWPTGYTYLATAAVTTFVSKVTAPARNFLAVGTAGVNGLVPLCNSMLTGAVTIALSGNVSGTFPTDEAGTTWFGTGSVCRISGVILVNERW